MLNVSNIVNGYLLGKSCNELGLEFNCCAMTIYKHLIRNGITLRKKWEGRTAKIIRTNLSETEKQIIDGCLLGDGSIIRKNDRSTSHFSLTTIHFDFIKLIRDNLSLPNFRIRERNNSERVFHGKKYKCNKSYDLISRVDKSLNEFREIWYPNGIKIIPRDLKLSPITIKYWFYGDGSTSFIKYKGKDTYVRLSFCTNGFTIDDCEFLVSSFKKTCNLNFNIYLSRGKPMLVALKNETIINLFNYIGNCDIPCFDYKWKRPVICENNKF